MANGSRKPIEQLKVGDEVIAGDPQEGTKSPEAIRRVIVGQGLKHLYDIHVAGGVIEATHNHPFWVTDTQNFDWAQNLKPSEHLLLADGKASPIASISHYDEITTVYNLSITDVHTFYVGDQSVPVHNSCISSAANDVQHVLDRHFEGGALANPLYKSISSNSLTVPNLISDAEAVSPYIQDNGNLAREVFAGRLVGSEQGRGQGTMFSL
jgi:hypothetical protein